MKTWSVSDISQATSLPLLQVDSGDNWFDLLETPQKIVFGGFCNAGFLESGFIVRQDGETLDETLAELSADLETYYRDGASYVSRIVCNERM